MAMTMMQELYKARRHLCLFEVWLLAEALTCKLSWSALLQRVSVVGKAATGVTVSIFGTKTIANIINVTIF